MRFNLDLLEENNGRIMIRMNLKRGRKLNLAQTKYGGEVTESEVLFDEK